MLHAGNDRKPLEWIRALRDRGFENATSQTRTWNGSGTIWRIGCRDLELVNLRLRLNEVGIITWNAIDSEFVISCDTSRGEISSVQAILLSYPVAICRGACEPSEQDASSLVDPIETITGSTPEIADVFHAYQIVRKNNVPAENIITFAYDDIANNPRNPFKGKVFHDYTHEDIYQGVEIDYRGKDVTRDNFVKVLKGDEKLAANKKKVLKSGPDDNVFIFYSGHGLVSSMSLLAEELHAVELNDILAHIHSKKKYNKLVLYMAACFAGSMFRDILPPNMGIYVTTASKEDELSWSIFCEDKDFDICLASEYAYVWIRDSEYHDLKTRTLDQQYEEVKKKTAYSHVMKYGEMAIGSLPVGKFQGHFDLYMHRNDGTLPANAVDRKPSLEAHLFSKSRRVMEATTDQDHQTAWRKLRRAIQRSFHGATQKSNVVRFDVLEAYYSLPILPHNHSSRLLQLGHIVKETFRDIVRDVKSHHKPNLKGLSKRDELMCFQAVLDQFRTHCFTIQQLDWAAANDDLALEIYTSADLLEAKRRFKTTRMVAGSAPSLFFADNQHTLGPDLRACTWCHATSRFPTSSSKMCAWYPIAVGSGK
ncbi:hypothetical protein T265_10942 [Opisthorchis viverrini]|uniref:Peptidase C13 family protein n=1 Tax=Opisthorchis viverrini TaxID=6198 RepID=A0A074ZZC4_OPIVI|nr:hypothetical protein T265_10942 [Opisthorchis viverrini]KER20529.1 hypothetical protein T265_10942 [Opisthorchis viverrini]